MTSLLRNLAHPHEQTLTRVAFHEPGVPHRVRDHLARCANCRASVSALRTLIDEARAIPAEAPRAELLDRIHARIAAGDEVLLPAPTRAVRPARRAGWRGAVGLVTATALAASTLLWISRPSSELTAGDLSGELQLTSDPAHPKSVTVEYRAPAPLGPQPTLVLRGRYRTAWSGSYSHQLRQVMASRLARVSGNLFRGSVQLPDSVVYAVFAVEDSLATYVDDRHSALWEWLARRADGQPTYDALRQREHDLMGRNMELAYETARRRAALYPEDPNAWSDVAFQEGINLGDVDSLLPGHLRRLAALDARYAAQRDVPFAIVDGMLKYRMEVTDSTSDVGRTVRDHWLPLFRRLVATDTIRTEAGVEARWWALNERAMKGADSARAVLPAAEMLWRNGGSEWSMAGQLGMQMARFARDSSATRTLWVDRQASRSDAAAEYLYASELGRVPALRPVAVARLHGLIAALERADDARRPLELTRREAAAADSARARAAGAMLADVLLARGDTAAARGALDRATAGGWDARLFWRAAEAHFRIRDTVGALPLLAKAAADPSLGAVADSLGDIGRRLAGPSRWAALTAASRAAMVRYHLDHSVRRRVADPVALAGADSRMTTLRDIAAGRVVVVAFWSRFCGPSRQQMSRLDSLAAKVAAQGAVLVPVAEEAPSAATAAYLAAQRVRVPSWFDVSRAASRALNNFATPQYYVIDQDGVLRFRDRDGSSDAVVAQVVALAAERGQGVDSRR